MCFCSYFLLQVSFRRDMQDEHGGINPFSVDICLRLSLYRVLFGPFVSICYVLALPCATSSCVSSRRNQCLWADMAGAAARWTFYSSAPARPALGKCSSTSFSRIFQPHQTHSRHSKISNPMWEVLYKLIGSLSRSRKFANFGVFRLAFGRAVASRHVPQTL